MQTVDAIVERVKRLVGANSLIEAEKTATHGLLWYPHEVRLLRLLGMVAGIQEHHAEARKFFLGAFEISGDGVDAANLVTATLAMGDAKTAVQMMADGLPLFSPDALRVIATSALEAIRIGTLRENDLPPEVYAVVVILKDEGR